MIRFILHILITAAALYAAVHFVDGLKFTGDWPQFIGVALIFGLVNALIRPLLKGLSCLIIVVTLGLFTLVINALMLWLTGWLSGEFGLGFHVRGFWPAFWGALVISLVSWVLSIFLPKKKRRDEE